MATATASWNHGAKHSEVLNYLTSSLTGKTGKCFTATYLCLTEWQMKKADIERGPTWSSMKPFHTLHKLSERSSWRHLTSYYFTLFLSEIISIEVIGSQLVDLRESFYCFYLSNCRYILFFGANVVALIFCGRKVRKKSLILNKLKTGSLWHLHSVYVVCTCLIIGHDAQFSLTWELIITINR